MGSNLPKIKVCGLTRAEDVQTCLGLGIDWIGFNFVPWSSRFVEADLARELWVGGTGSSRTVSTSSAQAIAVVADVSIEGISKILQAFPELAGVQFHGQETPQFLEKVRTEYPKHFLIKAAAVNDLPDVSRIKPSTYPVDLVLFDTARTAENSALPMTGSGSLSFPPKVAGGAGRPFPWEWLASCPAELRFGVAGGVGPHNIGELLNWSPDLIDLNSGVEDLPGRKSAKKLTAAVQTLRGHTRP